MKKDNTELKRIFFGISVAACILLIAVFLFPDTLFAQPSMPSDPTQTPVDGGLSILAALGGAYAIKKLRERD